MYNLRVAHKRESENLDPYDLKYLILWLTYPLTSEVYTPEFNPIEIQWREEEKGIGNAFFANKFEMKNTCRGD